MDLDISDDKIDRYLTGQMDEAELRIFLAELDKFPEQKERLLTDKEAYAALKIVRRAQMRKMLKETDKKLKTNRVFTTYFILFSAVILAFFLLYYFGC